MRVCVCVCARECVFVCEHVHSCMSLGPFSTALFPAVRAVIKAYESARVCLCSCTHKCIFPLECEKTDSAVREDDDSPDLHFTHSLHLPGKQTYHCYFQHMHMFTREGYTVDYMAGLSGAPCLAKLSSWPVSSLQQLRRFCSSNF